MQQKMLPSPPVCLAAHRASAASFHLPVSAGKSKSVSALVCLTEKNENEKKSDGLVKTDLKPKLAVLVLKCRRTDGTLFVLRQLVKVVMVVTSRTPALASN